MSHIVKSCPLTKLNGGLSRLHFVDEDAVSWLTSYGSRHAYEEEEEEEEEEAEEAEEEEEEEEEGEEEEEEEEKEKEEGLF